MFSPISASDHAGTSRLDEHVQMKISPTPARLSGRLFTRLPRALVLLLFLVVPGATGLPDAEGSTDERTPWIWPVEGMRQITEPFRAPSHAYGPGHRGIDMSARVGSVVRAPAEGVVAFRGTVVDRPLITIDHGAGIVTTLEPVISTLSSGSTVVAGDEIGTVARGGHTQTDELHLGVRWRDVYINPQLMFGPVPRAILLPCCE